MPYFEDEDELMAALGTGREIPPPKISRLGTRILLDTISPKQDMRKEQASMEDTRPRGEFLTIDLPSSTLANPRSSAANFVLPLQPVSENVALGVFLSLAQDPSEIYIEAYLSDFLIYADTAGNLNRLRTLHHLATSHPSEREPQITPERAIV